MTLYGPLESDARVLRSLDVFREIGKPVEIITCNTRAGFSVDGVKLVNLYLSPSRGGYLYFCFRVFFYYLFRGRRYDLIYLQDFYSTVPGLLLRLLSRKKRMIYDAHELILPAPGKKPAGRFKVFVVAERMLAGKVECVVEANAERAEIFRGQYHLSNVSHVLNISNVAYDGKRKELAEDGDVNLVYQGIITETRRLSFFIESMRDLPARYKLFLVGSGDDVENYKKLAEDHGVQDRVILTGRLGNKEMLAFLERCHIGIISYPMAGPNNYYCAPNKIFEYASKSLPFVATGQPFFKKIEQQYGTGRTFEAMDKASFVAGVEAVVEDYASMQDGLAKLLQDYNYATEHERMLRIIKGEKLEA